MTAAKSFGQMSELIDGCRGEPTGTFVIVELPDGRRMRLIASRFEGMAGLDRTLVLEASDDENVWCPRSSGHADQPSYAQLRADYDFLNGDQERLERTRLEALAEVDALRQVLVDMADELFPNPDVRSMMLRDGHGWRQQMMRAVAGLRVATTKEEQS